MSSTGGMEIFCKTKNLQSSYYLAEGRPEDSDSVKVLLLDLEAPGDPEVLFAVRAGIVRGKVGGLQDPQVLLVHPLLV